MDPFKIKWDGTQFVESGVDIHSSMKVLNHLKFYYIRNQKALALIRRALNCSRQLSGTLKRDMKEYLKEERC